MLSTLRQPGVVRRGMEKRLVKGKSLRHGREGKRGVCHDGRDWFQRGFRGGVR